MNTRERWVDSLTTMAYPVLYHASRGELKAVMPLEGSPSRADCTHLEALGRTICGIAPWLAATDLSEQSKQEEEKRQQFQQMALQAIAHAVDPHSPGYLPFADTRQNLVDVAFFCHGILRAKKQLWEPLSETTKQQLIGAVKSSRTIPPAFNNWLLFSGIVETFLYAVGEPDWDRMRVDYALRQMGQWYVGDGWYSDGPVFHFDYYNSLVIQPMLLDILSILSGVNAHWDSMVPNVIARAKRYAAILERLIGPDGSYPVFGRSVAYRYGVFQLLAHMALAEQLPEELSPAQVRCALDAVIRKVESHPAMYDEAGWLRIGIFGHQPSLGEGYISTGSLYLASTVFLPLGLSPQSPFWTAPDCPYTGQKLWNGTDLPCDHSISV